MSKDREQGSPPFSTEDSMDLFLEPISPRERRRKRLERFCLLGFFYLFWGGVSGFKYSLLLALFLLGLGLSHFFVPLWLFFWSLLRQASYEESLWPCGVTLCILGLVFAGTSLPESLLFTLGWILGGVGECLFLFWRETQDQSS